MKKTFKIFAAAVTAGILFAACGDKGNGGKPDPEPKYPDVQITGATEGAVKAGKAGVIEILGGIFEDDDYVYIGYANGGETVYERITGDVLDLRTNRITFGAPITATYIDKTFKVYLDRPGYEKMPLTGDIHFVMPDVSEGYIPDPGFRATLSSNHPQAGNPNIARYFDSYGLLDVAGVAAVTSSGCEHNYGLNLYTSNARSLEGIELLTGITGVVAGWEMTQIEEIDLSKWTAKKVDLRFNGLTTLKKFTGSPYAYRTDVYKCDNLTYVDLSPSKWCYNVQLFYDESPTTYSFVKHLDIRRQRTGTMFEGDATGEYPQNPDTDYAIFLAGMWMKVADNCKILVDYQFLLDKRQNPGADLYSSSGYATIFSAWQRGATIDVYRSDDITEKIGTVPMYADNSGALTLTGDNGWQP